MTAPYPTTARAYLKMSESAAPSPSFGTPLGLSMKPYVPESKPTISHAEARKIAETHVQDVGHEKVMEELGKLQANIDLLRYHMNQVNDKR